jgi:hypothetical protein
VLPYCVTVAPIVPRAGGFSRFSRAAGSALCPGFLFPGSLRSGRPVSESFTVPAHGCAQERGRRQGGDQP